MKTKLKSSFVRRQHMVSDDFEIYYYNDSNLSPVSLHSHDFYEFYFFLEGDIKMNVENNISTVKPQSFLFIPPGVKHCPAYINSTKPYRRFVLWISKDYYNKLINKSKNYGYIIDHVNNTNANIFYNDTITFNHIQSMIFNIIEVIKKQEFAYKEISSLNLNSLLIYLNSLVFKENNKIKKDQTTPLYLNICNYISENIDRKLSLEHLSEHFFVSSFYISHMFKDHMGISVHQYIIKKRLELSKEAITSGTPATKAFDKFGFNDYSSFYRAFKKEYGQSPSEYKKGLKMPKEF